MHAVGRYGKWNMIATCAIKIVVDIQVEFEIFALLRFYFVDNVNVDMLCFKVITMHSFLQILFTFKSDRLYPPFFFVSLKCHHFSLLFYRNLLRIICITLYITLLVNALASRRLIGDLRTVFLKRPSNKKLCPIVRSKY